MSTLNQQHWLTIATLLLSLLHYTQATQAETTIYYVHPDHLGTPQVMTDVSNLSSGIHGRSLETFFELITTDLSGVEEIYTPTQEVAGSGQAFRWGFTDLSLIFAARRGPLLLTTDAKLCEWCNREGTIAYNFNRMRTF